MCTSPPCTEQSAAIVLYSLSAVRRVFLGYPSRDGGGPTSWYGRPTLVVRVEKDIKGVFYPNTPLFYERARLAPYELIH
eukprot:scaffold71765_cov75-Phaeocystis_antarctica.AAC.4